MEDETEGNIITIQQLAQEVVNATKNKSSPNHLQQFLARVADVNESFLKKADDKFEFVDPIEGFSMTVAFKAVSNQPHITILHVQVFLWLMSVHMSAFHEDDSFLRTLEKHMLAVASSGGDIDLPICGVQFLVDGSQCIRSHLHIRPRELGLKTFYFLQMKETETKDRDTISEKLAAFFDLIEEAKERNPFQNSQPLSSFMKTLLLKEDFCDIEVLCPDGTVYPAHQCVMANSSYYFKTYFTGPWSRLQSGEGGGRGQYKIQVHSKILKYILTFMYTGNLGRSVVGMPTSTMCDIFHAAHEFQINDLVICCCKVLESRITLDTIKEIVICAAAMINSSSSQSSNNDGSSTNGSQNGADKRLWTGCIKFIRKNAANVLFDTDFYTLKDKYPNLWKDLRKKISQSRKRKRENGR